jgi:hypothetical protein
LRRPVQALGESNSTVVQFHAARLRQQTGCSIFLIRPVPVIASGDLRLTLACQMNRMHFDRAVDIEYLDDVSRRRRRRCGREGRAAEYPDLSGLRAFPPEDTDARKPLSSDRGAQPAAT